MTNLLLIFLQDHVAVAKIGENVICPYKLFSTKLYNIEFYITFYIIKFVIYFTKLSSLIRANLYSPL